MNRDGVGLMEVMVGMLVFTVGVLALAGSTTYVAAQLQSSDMRTERHTARQQVFEELRALPYDDVTTRLEANALTRGEYNVWWTVKAPTSALGTSITDTWALMEVEMYTKGPSLRGGDRRSIVVDTVTYRIARQIQ